MFKFKKLTFYSFGLASSCPPDWKNSWLQVSNFQCPIRQ